VFDLETSKEEAKSPLKGCEYKPTMGCDAERKYIYIILNVIIKKAVKRTRSEINYKKTYTEFILFT